MLGMQDLTRKKILNAAEELFSQQGFSNTSLRAITSRARVNLAAVNYHFGSKEALIQELFQRRLEPLNQERLGRLEALGAAPSVEDILRAYLEPTLKSGTQTDVAELRFMRLLGRTQMGALPELREFVHGLYAEVLDRFAAALSRALPQIPLTELYWRLQFLSGAVAYSMSASDAASLFAPCQLPDAGDNAALLARLIPFLSAGLTAPLPNFEAKSLSNPISQNSSQELERSV